MRRHRAVECAGPASGELDTIFTEIATDIGSGSSRLVDDGF